MAATGDLRQILGPARFNTLSSDTQSVLLQAWTTHMGILKSDLEKTRVDSEQKISLLQKKNQELETKLAVFTEESEKGQSALSLYREQATASGTKAARLTEENSKLAAEKDELKRQLNNAKAERDDVAGLAERRFEEIERLHLKVRELTEELNRAVAAKSEAQTRLEDLDTKEMNIAFKEKRFNEEKVFLESQMEMLKDEVERRNAEVLTAKREAGVRQIELKQELAEKTEELKILTRNEESLREDLESYKRRAEDLADRLKEAREAEARLEDNYRAELKSQTKLAELYRQQGEENTQMTEELTGAVTSLQQLLKEAGARFGQLEVQLETIKAEHKIETEKKVDVIQGLKKELDDANKLIKIVKDKGLTEDAIEHLSPSAAQASRLLKSGVTLTGIYSQMVSLSEDLTVEKEENKRLNEYMDQILIEIEQRAPILRQQREDYEQAVSAIGGLTENLEAAREEVELRRREAEEARRGLNFVEKDRDRLEQQVADLSRQVALLVREVEAVRTGGSAFEPLQTIDTSSLESVIEGRLLTFRDVTELQQRNIELLAVVRELSENREQSESSLVQERTAEIRQELDIALRQAEELRTARERQQLMVENIIQQRDLYKSMCKEPSQLVAAARKAEVPEESSRRTVELEKQLEELKAEFAEYKQDKRDNYNMLEKDCAKLREEMFQARSQAAKLASNEEYNTERFKIAQANCASFRKQIEALEMRNKQLDSLAAKHEDSISALREELLKQGRALSHAELKVDQLNQENSHLKAVEARLSAEREMLHREKNSTNQIMANLQQIQLNLERKDDEYRIKLQKSNSQLAKEVELLRKKLDEDQEHFKQSVRNWENTNKDLREKAERSEQSSANAMEQLAAMTGTLETMKEELKEKQEELQMAESRLAGRGQLSSQSSTVDGDGKNRYRDVEILLGKSKQEIKMLNNQLTAEKKKVEEFKSISETAETRMLESSKAMADYKNDSESKFKLLEDEKIAAEKISEESKTLVKNLNKKIEDLESEVGANGGVLREKLRTTTSELKAAEEKIAQLEAQDQESRQRMNVLAEDAKDAQEKYQRELVQHAQDIERLNLLKEETNSKISSMNELEVERRRAESTITELKESFKAETAKMEAEMVALKEQVALLGKQNEALMNQLEAVSGQMADLSATGQALNTSQTEGNVNLSNISFRSTSEDEASAEQLMSIIKFLRREKEIIGGRLEVSSAELARTSRQLEHAQKLLEDAQNALDMERRGSNENLMTASKHAELIRKVESLAALTDSNKMLREEKVRLSSIVDTAKYEAEAAKHKIEPLEAKIKEVEDKYANLLVEKNAVMSESEEWKKRSDQLVEKSFKMNPEELKRLQDAEATLKKSVHNLTMEKTKMNTQLSNANKELTTLKQSLASAQQEVTKTKEELGKKVKEVKAVSARENTVKNQLGNLSKQVNDLKKKVDEAEKLKQENLAAINKLRTDLAAAQSKASEAKTGGEENTTLRARVAELEAQTATQTEEINKHKTNLKSLRAIGRQFREKAEGLEEMKTTLQTEIEALKENLAKSTEDLTKRSEELRQAQSLVDGLKTEDIDKLIQENETLEKQVAELKIKEAKARTVLEKSRVTIGNLKEEIKSKNEILTEGGEKVVLEQKIKEIEALRDEKERMKSALEKQITAIRNENLALKNSSNDLTEERDRLVEQVEQLQQELISTQATSKPVAVAGVVHQQEVRKQPQPQAHIQPQPRDEHRPTQTASIRPMTQRAAAAVVLPTSQVSSVQPEIATVQPTVSVSPSVSSLPAQLPSTSQLDPLAPEFNPTERLAVAAFSETSEQMEDSFRITTSAVQDSVQASTSTPSVSVHGAQTSKSGSTYTSSSGGNTQTTASVIPTLKRSRELEAELASGDEEAAGPSGVQKKARTVSPSEELMGDNLETEAEDLGDSQDMDSDMEEGELETDQAEAGAVSSSNLGAVSAAVDELTEPFGIEEAEEGEISDGEEEEATALEIDVLAEDDAESGLEQEEGDHVAPDNTDQLEEPLADEEAENSSEPSSSTGAAVAGRAQPFNTVPGSGFEQDMVEDCVVPSTPKLAEPRRPDGFSEAVSSPQIPVPERFIFGESAESSSAGQLVGQEGAERTSIDISQLADDKEGRTVPGTPQPASPATNTEECLDVNFGSLDEPEQPEQEQENSEARGDSEESEPRVTEEDSARETEDVGSRETEEGVSSSGADAPSSRPTRTPIIWAGSPAGPASTSPQRTLNRTSMRGVTQALAPGTRRQLAVRGVGKARGGVKKSGI